LIEGAHAPVLLIDCDLLALRFERFAEYPQDRPRLRFRDIGRDLGEAVNRLSVCFS
jgi:hypothetical protein